MTYIFDNNLAIYKQIVDKIKSEIISQKLIAGQKLKSIREYSADFGVTPNTIQKALAELENESLIFTERTSGKFITNNSEVIKDLKNNVAIKKTDKFLKDMFELGYTKQEVIDLLKNKKENTNE